MGLLNTDTFTSILIWDNLKLYSSQGLRNYVSFAYIITGKITDLFTLFIRFHIHKIMSYTPTGK
jgi:hypothetical protein